MRDAAPRIGLKARGTAAGLAVVLGLLAMAGGSGAQAASLTGWLSPATSFPNRSMVLFTPGGKTASGANVHVTENGVSPGPVTVTPVSHAPAGGFGVMVLVDQNSSMSGAPLKAAMAATRELAQLRKPGQALGLTTFDSSPTLFLHPTADAGQIDKKLTFTPWTGQGANVPAAISQAAAALSAAHVKLGAIVVISDGVGSLTSRGGPTPAAAQAAAVAARVPIVTVGLRDAATTATTLKALSTTAGGQFVSATPAALPGVMKQIYATVTRGYFVDWRSHEPQGHTVNVSVTVGGVPGAATASYRTPATPAAPAAPARHPAAPAPTHLQPVHFPAFSFAHQLTKTPPFGTGPGDSSAPGRAASHSSFWGSSTGVLAAAGIVGLLLAVALMPLLYRPSRAVRTRVGSFTPAIAEGEVDPLSGAAHPEKTGLLRLIEHSNWWPPFVEDVEIAEFKSSPVGLVKRSAVTALVVGILAALIVGVPIVAFVPLIGWPFVLRSMAKRKAEKKRRLFRDVLPTYLQDLSSAMRVGRSFVGGLDVITDGAEEPIKSELERVVTDEALGRPLDESLDAVAERMKAPDVEQVALIAALNRRSGSNVAEALDRVAEGARERADMRREIRALTAQGKMSSYVLTALPALLLVGINVVSPKYAHPLFHTTVGIILVVVGTMMTFGGWKVMQKICTVGE